MRITSFNSVRNSSASKRTGKASNSTPSSFEDLLAAASNADTTSAVSEPTGVQPVNPMLALQEVSDEEVKRGALIKHGELSLDALERLRQALLMGSLPADILRSLETTLTRQRTIAASDPKLNELLDDIELRVAVELAKIEIARRGV